MSKVYTDILKKLNYHLNVDNPETREIVEDTIKAIGFCIADAERIPKRCLRECNGKCLPLENCPAICPLYKDSL